MRYILLLLLTLANHTLAKGVYQTGPEFIQETFGTPLSPKVLWLDANRKQQAAGILGHEFSGFRVRYWQDQNPDINKTAWILDEIGKELPITIGVVVNDNRIESVKILTYRESRGGEVKYPAFLQQFENLTLVEDNKLSGPIDGITGATLSVWAVTNISRLALYFHQLTLSH